MRSILTMVVIAVANSVAYADLITLETTSFLRSNYTGARTILVPRFNPSLGTLNSITLNINAEISGTIAGLATGPANSPNGWATEFTGELRLSGTGFSVNRDASYGDRSGLVFQPNTPIFQFFEASVRPITVSFNTNMASYVGTGSSSISISWPNRVQNIYYSRSGTTTTRLGDLGVQSGTVTYSFTAVPEPTSLLLLLPITFGCCLFRNRAKCE